MMHPGVHCIVLCSSSRKVWGGGWEGGEEEEEKEDEERQEEEEDKYRNCVNKSSVHILHTWTYAHHTGLNEEEDDEEEDDEDEEEEEEEDYTCGFIQIPKAFLNAAAAS